MSFESSDGLEKHKGESTKHHYCTNCSLELADAESLILHREAKHRYCRVCEESFATANTFDEHKIWSQSHFYCWKCRLDFAEDESLISHREAKHNYCRVCNQTFENSEALNEHRTVGDKHHDGRDCNTELSNNQKVDSHVPVVHSAAEAGSPRTDITAGTEGLDGTKPNDDIPSKKPPTEDRGDVPTEHAAVEDPGDASTEHTQTERASDAPIEDAGTVPTEPTSTEPIPIGTAAASKPLGLKASRMFQNVLRTLNEAARATNKQPRMKPAMKANVSSEKVIMNGDTRDVSTPEVTKIPRPLVDPSKPMVKVPELEAKPPNPSKRLPGLEVIASQPEMNAPGKFVKLELSASGENSSLNDARKAKLYALLRKHDTQNMFTTGFIYNTPISKANDKAMDMFWSNTSVSYKRSHCGEDFVEKTASQDHLGSDVHQPHRFRCPRVGCASASFTSFGGLLDHIQETDCAAWIKAQETEGVEYLKSYFV
ncbi:hypothetical protein DL769_005747 [Monosporascus sp. CRB-8-3]|nr:hypothetical protein DL769_005747 [Monosporascus sp. CRB-8-3]